MFCQIKSWSTTRRASKPSAAGKRMMEFAARPKRRRAALRPVRQWPDHARQGRGSPIRRELLLWLRRAVPLQIARRVGTAPAQADSNRQGSAFIGAVPQHRQRRQARRLEPQHPRERRSGEPENGPQRRLPENSLFHHREAPPAILNLPRPAVRVKKFLARQCKAFTQRGGGGESKTPVSRLC